MGQSQIAPQSERRLPHFIVIGAMKSGTTTLYRLLEMHPDIDMSRDKEPDFFLEKRNLGRGLDWYCEQFSGDALVRGEASPNYSKCHIFRDVPERIAQLCPHARLIYIVRDPVARAESHIRHNVIMGNLVIDPDAFVGTDQYNHILHTSRYALQIEAYFEHFSAEAVLVLEFEELIRNPQETMSRVHSHIGVRDRRIVAAGVQNDSEQLARVPAPILKLAQSTKGRAFTRPIGRRVRDRLRSALARGPSRKPPPIPDALRTQLREDLAPDVARFRDLTGIEFKTWSL